MALTTIGVGSQRAAADVRTQITSGGGDVAGKVFQACLLACLGIALAILVALIANVWSDASEVLPSRTSELLGGQYGARAVSAGIFNALRGTFWIGVFTVLSFPIGIAAAVYLEEYASTSFFTNFINVNIRNLSGVPSVVFGIFGLTILVQNMDAFTGGKTVIAAGITISLLVLPIVIITSAEAIRAVPGALREGAFGLGATRWEVIRSHVLPYAAPGILTGTVLSLARAIGETAPLILVGATTGYLGTNASFAESFQEHFTALPVIIFRWASLPDERFRALTAAAIMVLMTVLLLLNSAAILLRNRYDRKW